MTSKLLLRTRSTAAVLMTISGLLHIASLWFTPLSAEALVGASFGAIYLFIAIGLFGLSRFSLFAAIIAPGIGLALGLGSIGLTAMSPLGQALAAIDVFVIISSAIMLYKLRLNPSV